MLGTTPEILRNAVKASPEHPVLVDRFLADAIEVDVDALCDGERVVVFVFDVAAEPDISSVAIESLVGNDYRVEVLGLYEADPRQRGEESHWKIGGVEALARAEGNVQDLANLVWIELDVGAWTGRSIVSVDGSWRAGNAPSAIPKPPPTFMTGWRS